MTSIRLPSRTRAGLALPAVLLSLGLLTAACGGSGGGDQVASVNQSKNAAEGSDKEKAKGDKDDPRAFAACMRKNGVDMKDPDPDGSALEFGGDGLDQEAMSKAMEACREYMQTGSEAGAELSEKQKEHLRKWTKCMRDAGFDVPDPDSGGAFPSQEASAEASMWEASMKCDGEVFGGGKAGDEQ
ncbi:hypothetical protein [Streptomyces sp. NPDC002845]